MIILNFLLFSTLLFRVKFAKLHNYVTKLTIIFQAQAEFVRGCYWPNWITDLHEKYVPGLCTHIFFAFATMDEKFTILPGNDDENGLKLYEKTVALKKDQSDLKVILAFGGTGFSHNKGILMEQMGKNATNRGIFIQSVVKLLKTYHFDGINIDWQYPTVKEEFTALLAELKQAFNDTSLLLTVAVSGKLSLDKISDIYDVVAIAPHVDMLNVICYNFHEQNEVRTGFTSPLIGTIEDINSIKNAAKKWAKGFDKSKIIIGLPTYANGWELTSINNAGVGAPARGPSPPIISGTSTDGVASYTEICGLLQQGATEVYDFDQESPYLVYNSLWYSYESERSFRAKAKWIKANEYGGAYVWALNHDDPNGKCFQNNGRRFPLTTVLKTFESPAEPSATIEPIISTSTESSTSKLSQSTTASTNADNWSTTSSPIPKESTSSNNAMSSSTGTLKTSTGNSFTYAKSSTPSSKAETDSY